MLRINLQLFQDIILLNDVGFHNITVGCWEFGLYLNFHAQLFEHLIVIFGGPTEQELHVELCYGILGFELVIS